MTRTDSGALDTMSVLGALVVHQDRVAQLLAVLPPDEWDAAPDPGDAAELADRGHFPDYATELEFTARQIAGHLRDSAHIFAGRITALREQDDPWLADFVTDTTQRLDDYAATRAEELAVQLDGAQRELRAAIAHVAPAELDRTGRHETDGTVTLRGMLGFLPGHQRDHADQLDALAARAGG